LDKKAVAFAKFGDTEPKSVKMNVLNPKSDYLRFILGGKDDNRYPAFNGVFFRVIYSD
jgi:hypothetical protein